MKYTVKDITDTVEAFAPLEVQDEGDNSGLNAGSKQAGVSAVLLCLDVTKNAVDKAEESGCEMIFSHHPPIYYTEKNVTDETYQQSIVLESLKKGISLYCAHTNLDNVQGGLCDEFAKNIGIENAVFMCGDGTGRIGKVKGAPTLKAFAENVKNAMPGCSGIRVSGDPARLISTCAVINGGGGGSKEYTEAAIRSGADCFVTGDIKHHNAVRLRAEGVSVVEVGHFDSEIHFVPVMKKLLEAKLPGLRIYEFIENPFWEA